MMTAARPVVEKTNAKVEKGTEKIYWAEVKRYPYQPDQQVELMHLQAEADALLIKLQAKQAKAASAQAD